MATEETAVLQTIGGMRQEEIFVILHWVPIGSYIGSISTHDSVQVRPSFSGGKRLNTAVTCGEGQHKFSPKSVSHLSPSATLPYSRLVLPSSPDQPPSHEVHHCRHLCCPCALLYCYCCTYQSAFLEARTWRWQPSLVEAGARGRCSGPSVLEAGAWRWKPPVVEAGTWRQSSFLEA